MLLVTSGLCYASSKNSLCFLTHQGLTQSSRVEFAGLKGTLFLDLFPLLLSAKPQMHSFSSSPYLTINFPVEKAELLSAVVNRPLFHAESAASLRSSVRNAVKKAIKCEESNEGKH